MRRLSKLIKIGSHSLFIIQVLFLFGTVDGVVQISFEELGDSSCEATEYFDSTNLVCQSCTDSCISGTGSDCNKVPNYDFMDPNGNALECKCDVGYLKVLATNLANDGDWPQGTVIGFSCTRAYDVSETGVPIHRVTALEDGSNTASCDFSTDGLSTSGDCSCGTAPADDAAVFTLDVLVEGDAAGNYANNKSCVSCSSGTAVVSTSGTYAGVDYVSDLYSCQRCPDPNMDMADRCTTCGSGYTATPYGVSDLGALTCVYQTHATVIEGDYNTGDSAYDVVYRQVQDSENADYDSEITVSGSLAMTHYFINATANCYFYKGPENNDNCQSLANLCVLQLFDQTSQACIAFDDIEQSRKSGTYEQSGWGNALPWLVYDEAAAVVTGDSGITMTLGLDTAAVSAGNVDASQLRFYLGVTSLNGTWLGLQEVDTQFFYCGAPSPRTSKGGGTSKPTNWLRYGNSFRDVFQCDLEELFGREPLFYEPFIMDEATGMLFPVPVIIRDYVDTFEAKLNENFNLADEADDVYVRRFALFDSLSGLNSDGHTEYPEVVRYAKKMKLKISSFSNEASRIKPPVLELIYGAREPRLGSWSKEMRHDSIQFSVEYSMERSDYDETMYAFFTTTCVLSGLAAFLRWQHWCFRNLRVASTSHRRRHKGEDENQPVLGYAGAAGGDLAMRGRDCVGIQQILRSQQWAGLVILAHSWSIFNFALLWAHCTTYFVLFKMQSETEAAYILLPPNPGYQDESDDYFFLKTILFTMTFNHTIFLLYQIYLQCTSDVFFVDMETGAGLLPLNATSPNVATASQPSSGVSGWRRILIANEWTKMCGTRRTSIEFTLFWMAFALVGNDLEYLATPQPNLHDHDAFSCGADSEFNFLLRFANSTWWFAILELFQLVVEHIRRYLACVGMESEPLGQQLVDLCTTAKISVVSLVDTYHGYILFCDSSADSADTSIRDLTKQLLMEMKGDRHAARRGPSHLAGRPGFEDVQAFELYISDGWLRWYKQLQLKLESVARKHPQGSTSGGGDWNMPGRSRGRQSGCFSSMKQSIEERQGVLLIGGMEVLNEKLFKFLKGQYTGDLEWEAVSHAKTSLAWLWHMLRTVPREIRESRMENALVPDASHRFTRCGLYGIEFELWLRDVLTFAVADLWFNDTITSIFVTYATYQALRLTRMFFGSMSLSQSSLVDSTFLFK